MIKQFTTYQLCIPINKLSNLVYIKNKDNKTISFVPIYLPWFWRAVVGIMCVNLSLDISHIGTGNKTNL